MRIKISILLLFLTCVLALSYVQAQTSSDQIANEVIAITKAQWAAEAQRNTAESMKNIADDYTEFNPDLATRVEGKAQATKFVEALNKGTGDQLASEMLNPKVQVYGDVAILSYNYAGVVKNKDGETSTTRAKSTRIYAKIGGKWMLVHANFGSDPSQE